MSPAASRSLRLAVPNWGRQGSGQSARRGDHRRQSRNRSRQDYVELEPTRMRSRSPADVLAALLDQVYSSALQNSAPHSGQTSDVSHFSTLAAFGTIAIADSMSRSVATSTITLSGSRRFRSLQM